MYTRLLDWQYSWGDDLSQAKWSNITLPSQPQGRDRQNWLWERVIIPRPIPQEAAIFFMSVDQIFEVYADGKKIYNFGDLSVAKPKSYIGYSGHLVLLPPDMKDPWLYVRIYSAYPSIGIFSEVYYGSRFDHLKKLIRKELDAMALGSFFLIIGVFVLLLYVLGNGKSLIEQTGSFITFGLVQLSIGAMVIAQLHLKTVLYYNPVFWMYVDLISLFLIPVFVHAFFQSIIAAPLQKWVKWLWISHLAFFCTALALDLLKILPLHSMLKPFEILLLAGVSVMFVMIIISFIKGNSDVRIFTLGILLLVAFGIYDILGDMRIVHWTHSVLHWGMLFFTFTLLTIIIRRFRDISGRLSANQRELEIARLVQKEVLPSELSLEQFAELDIVVSYLPQSGNVGGDYYSITPLREGLASVAIADATGHGIQAALSTMQIDVLVKENMDVSHPHEKLYNINSVLTKNITSKNFFTCFFLNIYPDHIEYSSAGHPEQLLYHRQEKVLSRIHTRGKPIGVLSEPDLEMKIEPLAKGDFIILFSDGVYEEIDEKENELGLDGFYQLVMDVLQEEKNLVTPKMVESAILQKIRQFNQNHALRDDVTLIVIKVKES